MTSKWWKTADHLFWILVGVILGCGLAQIWFALLARPGPQNHSAQVVLRPAAPSQPPAAEEKVITAQGRVQGRARRLSGPSKERGMRDETPSVEIAVPGGNLGGVEKEDTIIPEGGRQESPVSSPPLQAFAVGERAEGRVQGELEIIDQEGRPLTESPLHVEGNYTVTFPAPGVAELDFRFEAPAMLSLKLPEEPDRAIRLGASVGWLTDEPFAAVYGEYIRRWRFSRSFEAQAGIEAGWAWTSNGDGPYTRIEAALEYRF